MSKQRDTTTNTDTDTNMRRTLAELDYLLTHDAEFVEEVMEMFAPLIAKVEQLTHPGMIPLLPERAESYEQARGRVIETYTLNDHGELLHRRGLLDREAFEQGMYRGWTRTKQH